MFFNNFLSLLIYSDNIRKLESKKNLFLTKIASMESLNETNGGLMKKVTY